ncbi:30S ribosomal protein S16 [Rothia sp. HMSC058E10]|uniref:Small ribosomal subunit protein bS16 n=2 Tax=Rothia dentocariosa TaxID=2047 RepID=A0A269YLP4_9MICC|nr:MULTISPECIES: 30S ribosomal protein S16 [Rothia]ADP41576.1 ribosomal protein S16 [Rothia dentocariosa ATCC 17931]MBF1650153.1 30S ribosomal protein S16 [Rothia dentocariosa]MCM3439084.1 30S ribosomal protein S16 [Rothia dentocariosa]NLR25347.1 30S ribosomal protein S16 [Rothia dentocariosa]OFK72925.1 30S ribosomal protein S16 [Rothia sp. HMSC065G12]
MAVKIRLKRMGKIRDPRYRIVIADSRVKRDGKTIEEIGIYHPTEQPSRIEINSERAQYWLSVGAQPTEQVLALLKLSGDWATFKGEKAENSIKPVEPKAEFVVPQKGSVILPEAITPKADKAEEATEEAPAEAEAEAAEEAAE